MIELPYLLKAENIARLEDDKLLIGDRRVYPFEKRFETCSDINEIANALKSMVTQGGGPLQVAMTSMLYIGKQMQKGHMNAGFATLVEAANLLIQARPTNTTMKRTLQAMLKTLEASDDFIVEIPKVVDSWQQYYDDIYHRMGKLGSTLIPEKATILTTCFAEHTFLLSLAYAKEEGKEIQALVPETRPYLQGSRLTAPSLEEMGIKATVITDGMGATFLSEGFIDLYLTAADLVCMDGTVVNKVGTLANALAAKQYQVPYYAFSISPDPTSLSKADIHMEWRDAKEVTQCMGRPTTLPTISGLYPAFDIIDSSLVSGIVTGKGLYKPEEIRKEFL